MSRLHQRYQEATEAQGRQPAAIFPFRAFGENVRTSQGEDQEHVGGPDANAFDLGEVLITSLPVLSGGSEDTVPFRVCLANSRMQVASVRKAASCSMETNNRFGGPAN